MVESVNVLFKTELHRNPAVLSRVGGHWKGLDDLEVETCAWVSWFNTERSTESSATSPPTRPTLTTTLPTQTLVA